MMLLRSIASSSTIGAHPHHPQPILCLLFSWCPCCYLGPFGEGSAWGVKAVYLTAHPCALSDGVVQCGAATPLTAPS